MADNLTDTVENELLDALVGTASYSITGATKLALVTAAGSDSAAGTEVTGGSYGRQTITWDAAASGAVTNAGTVSFTDMPTCTVVGIEIYDSNGTPKRLVHGTLTAPKSLVAGDTLQFAAGSIVITLG